MKRAFLLGTTCSIIILVLTALTFSGFLFTPTRSNPTDGSTAKTFEAFLKIDVIQGESQDHDHRGEIEITSFSWNGTQGAKWGGRDGGLTSCPDFYFTMNYSKASLKLFLASAKGQVINTVVLTVRRASDKKEYLKYTFSSVKITSYRTAGDVYEDPVPVDQISINFTKIEVWYQQYDSEGRAVGSPIKSSWDLQKGSGK